MNNALNDEPKEKSMWEKVKGVNTRINDHVRKANLARNIVVATGSVVLLTATGLAIIAKKR